jgi:hypothetical protein
VPYDFQMGSDRGNVTQRDFRGRGVGVVPPATGASAPEHEQNQFTLAVLGRQDLAIVPKGTSLGANGQLLKGKGERPAMTTGPWLRRFA